MTRYLKYILSVTILLIAFAGGCTQTNNQSTPLFTSAPTEIQNQSPINLSPTPLPSVAPPFTDPSIEEQIPYSRNSIWNTPIGPFVVYDPYSDEMVANLIHANDGEIITPSTYNYPVYFADANTPRWNIPCTIYKCTIASSDNEVIRTEMLQNVPIPNGAQPAPDTDGRMIIIDKDTHTEYDLWRATRVPTGWEAGNGSIYNTLWDATPVMHSSRGSGIPSYAGLVRPWEILQGRIDHALAFGYTEPAAEKCVFPASKTDGDSSLPYAIPEGARLQLDPTLTEADFDRMGLNRTGKIIARVLQEYGMVSVDHSGSFKIYIEDLENNPFSEHQWTDPELNLTTDTLSKIPYTAFKVLELPPGYWQEDPNTVYHGKCITFPDMP